MMRDRRTIWWKKLQEADALHAQLWDAIGKNDVPGVVSAVTKGASLRAQFRSNEPNPPLIYPSMYGWIQMVDALIGLGADVNQPGENGNTPLMAAAYAGQADIVERLLQKGADVHAVDKDRKTALDSAKQGINERTRDRIIEMLQRQG